MRSKFLILVSLVMVSLNVVSTEQNVAHKKMEQSVCGLKEPFMFWLWSSMAGSPNANRLAGLRNVKDISFTTADNRVLRGYMLKATEGDESISAPKGYLLVLQGNAILADQILKDFTDFSSAGLDVYIYDYRGYGRSDGKRRLKAIVNDYVEIVAALNSADYDRRYIYAMSFGGIAFLNGFEKHAKFDRIVVDSTPSRLSDYGCPPEWDPANHLPDDASELMFIVGRNDRVVSRSMSRQLVETARQRNATIFDDKEFGHPFMDSSWKVHRRRLQVVEDYLLFNKKP